MSTDSPVNQSIEKAAEAQAARVLAAQEARSAQATRKVATVAKPSTKPKVRTGVKVATVKNGKAKQPPKKTASAPRPEVKTVSKAESERLAKESAEIQKTRIAQAQDVLKKSDQANWELAKLTFEATEEDGPARMSKTDWANALGLSPSVVSRWVATHREYGLPQNRQRRQRGGPELSFNDHVEMTKVKDPGELKAVKDRMLAEKTSFAVALKKTREATQNGQATAKSTKDKDVAAAADLQSRALATNDNALEAFTQLGVAAINAISTFTATLKQLDSDRLDDAWKQIVKNVSNEADELNVAFEAILNG